VSHILMLMAFVQEKSASIIDHKLCKSKVWDGPLYAWEPCGLLKHWGARDSLL